MPREVIIENTTFLVYNYSKEGATETVEEILERVIIKDAEQEFKKHPFINSENDPEVI